MNAALRAVTRSAIERGVGVMGIYRGFRGLLENDIRPLGYRDMSGILHEGGTIIYSDRCDEFRTLEGQKKRRRYAVQTALTVLSSSEAMAHSAEALT